MASFVDDALTALMVLAMPSPCLGCERPVREWRPRLGLCVHCRGRIRPTGVCCHQCGQLLSASDLPTGFCCDGCRRSPPSWDRLLAPYRYEPPLDAVVRHLKFGGLAYLGGHAAEAIHQHHARALDEVEVVVPLPLHWRRRLARGFNQAREISRPLARRIERPHATALYRKRPTTAQARLSRADRLNNPAGAFRPRHRHRLAGRHVLLVDDVVTTGATLEAAATALKGAGVSRVTVAVLARTQPPGDADRSAWQES